MTNGVKMLPKLSIDLMRELKVNQSVIVLNESGTKGTITSNATRLYPSSYSQNQVVVIDLSTQEMFRGINLTRIK